jgi:NhaP-type Na+/H+ or K+/H+ antiporter
VLNQYGTAITIPVVTAVALAFGGWVLAAALAISGVTVYLVAKVIKGYVDRGRPSALLEGVAEREHFSPESLGVLVAAAVGLLLGARKPRTPEIPEVLSDNKLPP